MVARFIQILLATLVATSLCAPAAFAASKKSEPDPSTAVSSAMELLQRVESVRIGANSTVVTIQDGAKAHPILIEYGNALHTGAEKAGSISGSESRPQDSNAAANEQPKGVSLGQIAAWMILLGIASRVVSLARQISLARRGR